MEKFSSCIFTAYPIDETDFKDLFKNYLECEEYDPEKEYVKEGDGFETILYTIGDTKDRDRKVKYVVKKEKVSAEELKELAPYCQCAACQKPWYDFSKYSMCPCCYGCVKVGQGYASVNVVADSRRARDEYKAKKENILSFFSIGH